MEPDDRIAQRRRQNDALSNYRIFPRPGPKLYTAVIWYAFGLYVLLVARAPFTPSPEDEQKYSDLMQAAVWSPEMKHASTPRELEAGELSMQPLMYGLEPLPGACEYVTMLPR